MKIAGIIKSSLIDYPGKASTVIFLGGCNFRCGYCHNPEFLCTQQDKPEPAVQNTKGKEATGVAENGIDLQELVFFLRKRKRFLDGVCISGGEPTLNEGLPELMAEIENLGLSVKLDTNGTNPDMLKKLLAKGLVDYVAMDIKGPGDKYQQIVRHPVNLNDIMKSAEILIDAFRMNKFPCEFRTTVCRELLSEKDIERMIAEHPGAPTWYLQRFHNPGNILDNTAEYTAYTLEEMEDIGKRLCVSVR